MIFVGLLFKVFIMSTFSKVTISVALALPWLGLQAAPAYTVDAEHPGSSDDFVLICEDANHDIGIGAFSGAIGSFTGDKIEILNFNKGVNTQGAGTLVNFGSADKKVSDLKIVGKQYGIHAQNQSEVSINAKNVDISTTDGGSTLMTQNGKISINADSIKLSGGSIMSKGADNMTGTSIHANDVVSISGTVYAEGGLLEVKSKNINIEGDIKLNSLGQTTIGALDETQEHTVHINGNIEKKKEGSQLDDTTVINIDLGSHGSLKGAIDVGAADSTLDLGEDSSWIVTGDSLVANLNGQGELKLGTDGGAEGVYTVGIANADDDLDLNVSFDGITSDDVSSAEALKNLIGEKVTVADSALEGYTANLEEGEINGAITVNSDGTSVVAENTKLSDFRAVNSTTMLQWRHEMNDLTKRMGELRMSPEGIGSWVRLYGSEQEYGDQNVETKNTSIQVGSDYDVGSGWKVGAAFSYTDSSSSMLKGEADGDMYGVAVYGSWLNDDGQFVDMIAKYSRLTNDFTSGNMSGSYDNNAFSVSAEYGWHWKLSELAFVEPQVEVTYGRVIGDDVMFDNGVAVSQDDMDSLIGRLGMRGGFYFPDNKGTLYARLSVLHDFEGEAGFRASTADNSTALTDDLGGTWYEFGIGANLNLTDSTYTYVDLEKSTGGEVKENWRWNIGLRTVF